MTAVHCLCADKGLAGGAVMGWCECGLVFTSSRGSHRKSWRAVWRAYRQHCGFVFAAGMAPDPVG